MLLWPPIYSMLEEKSPFCLVQNHTLIRKGGGGGEGGYLKSDATFPTLLSRIVDRQPLRSSDGYQQA